MARIAPSPRSIQRFLQFCLVGASGVIVNLAVFWGTSWLLSETTGLGDDARFLVANLAGFAVSVVTNFLLNDAWTWRDRRTAEDIGRRFLQFALVASLAGGVQLSVAYGARRLLPSVTSSLGLAHWTDTLAVLVGIGVATIINFVLNHLWTFRRRSGAEPSGRG